MLSLLLYSDQQLDSHTMVSREAPLKPNYRTLSLLTLMLQLMTVGDGVPIQLRPIPTLSNNQPSQLNQLLHTDMFK